MAEPASISIESLNDILRDQSEFALLDVRDPVDYINEHLWLAVNLPHDNIVARIGRFVPRKTTRIVLYDEGEQLVQKVERSLDDAGYTDVYCLQGGAAAWAASRQPVVTGDYVISHSFGFSIESAFGIPVISAADLNARLQSNNNIVVIDTRDESDYRRSSLPGSISVPVAEVVRRIPDLIRDEQTQVVVHCAGVTRAALGAQTMINAGLPNPVFSLRDGTRGWLVAGGDLMSDQPIVPPQPGQNSRQFALKSIKSLAQRHSLNYITPGELTQWRAQNTERTCYLIDVRTYPEYIDGHYPGAMHVPGGELAGMTIDHIGTYHARLCLIDNGDCARAEITAGWMLQIGWNDVVILKNWRDSVELEHGEERGYTPRSGVAEPHFQTHEELLEHHRQSIATRYEIYERFLQDRPWEFCVFND